MRYRITEMRSARTVYLVDARNASEAELKCLAGGAVKDSEEVLSQTFQIEIVEHDEPLAAAEDEPTGMPDVALDWETLELVQRRDDEHR